MDDHYHQLSVYRLYCTSDWTVTLRSGEAHCVGLNERVNTALDISIHFLINLFDEIAPGEVSAIIWYSEAYPTAGNLEEEKRINSFTKSHDKESPCLGMLEIFIQTLFHKYYYIFLFLYNFLLHNHYPPFQEQGKQLRISSINTFRTRHEKTVQPLPYCQLCHLM